MFSGREWSWNGHWNCNWTVLRGIITELETKDDVHAGNSKEKKWLNKRLHYSKTQPILRTLPNIRVQDRIRAACCVVSDALWCSTWLMSSFVCEVGLFWNYCGTLSCTKHRLPVYFYTVIISFVCSWHTRYTDQNVTETRVSHTPITAHTISRDIGTGSLISNCGITRASSDVTALECQ